MSKKSTKNNGYAQLELYISNGNFTSKITEEPTIKQFEKVIGEKTILVAQCVLNTEEHFPCRYTKDGTPRKQRREYINLDNEDYDGKKIDYVEKDPAWSGADNEWLYCLAYDKHIVKIGQTIGDLKSRYQSYSCGTFRAMKIGNCSTTNFIVSECNYLAVRLGMEVEIYGIPVPKKEVKTNRFGRTKMCVLSLVRDQETMLTQTFKTTYSHKPFLCVQEGK